MRILNPAEHLEANKRANGRFTKDGTFAEFYEIKTDVQLIQAYQDYLYVSLEMSGMNKDKASKLAALEADQFTEHLPALKVLFRKRLDNR